MTRYSSYAERKGRGFKNLALASSAIALTAAHAPAFAAELASSPSVEPAGQARPWEVEDVVVTARRVKESSLNVPVAVSAISAEQIARASVSDLSRVVQLVPQVMFVRGGSGAGASFIIRGIGSNPFDAGIEQTVGLSLDGVPVGRGRIITQGMYDVEQVEVLKGPQVLFFGKNSPAGVVSVTTAGPGKKFEASVKAGYEFVADERSVEAVVSSPLSDTLGVRLAVRGAQSEGYLTNDAYARAWPLAPAATGIIIPGSGGAREPAVKEYGGRLTIAFKPTDDLDITLKGALGHYQDKGAAGNQAVCAPGVLPTASGIADPTIECAFDGHRASQAIPTVVATNWIGLPADKLPGLRLQTTFLTSTINYSLGNVMLTSVTGYGRVKSKLFDTSDVTTIGTGFGLSAEDSKSFTQEVRMASSFEGPLNFTVGGFYERARREQDVGGFVAFLGADPVTGRYYTYDRVSFTKGRTYSVFGQVRFKIMSNVELAGGVRYSDEQKNTTQSNAYLHTVAATSAALRASLPLRLQGDVVRSGFSDTNYSPEATVTWKPQDDLTIYAAYKTGYKSGGVSTPSTLSLANTAQNLIFRPEKAKGEEIGLKSRLFDRKVRLDLTAYQYDFNDLQVSSYDAVTNSFSILNAAQARTKGFEASANWRVNSEMTLNTSLAYNDAKYRSFPNAPCYSGQSAALGCVVSPTSPRGAQNLAGHQLPRAPAWSFMAGATYDTPITNKLMIGLNADVNYTSAFDAIDNLNPLGRQGAVWKINAGIRLYQNDEAWQIALIGRNLTNEYVFGPGIDKPFGGAGQISVPTQRPREVTVQLTARF